MSLTADDTVRPGMFKRPDRVAREAVDIGGFLKDARERRHLTVEQLADATKFPVAVFECIERNELHRLPGGVLTVACLRAYAREVGIDAELVISAYAVDTRARGLGIQAAPKVFGNGLAGWWVTAAIVITAVCLILASCRG